MDLHGRRHGFRSAALAVVHFFTYALLVLPLRSRLVAMVVGWLMDLHGGGRLVSCDHLLFGFVGGLVPASLAFLKSSLFLFGSWDFIFNPRPIGGLMWPFPNAHDTFSFFEWVAAGLQHGVWAVTFYPLYGFCSKALALESEEVLDF